MACWTGAAGGGFGGALASRNARIRSWALCTSWNCLSMIDAISAGSVLPSAARYVFRDRILASLGFHQDSVDVVSSNQGL